MSRTLSTEDFIGKRLVVEQLDVIGDVRSPLTSKITTDIERTKINVQQVTGDVSGILDELTAISSDDSLTPSEKQTLYRQWQALQSEYSVVTVQATERGVDPAGNLYAAYEAAYRSIESYLFPTILGVLTTTCTVEGLGADLRAKFDSYFSARASLQEAVERKVTTEIGSRPTYTEVVTGFEAGGGTIVPGTIPILAAIPNGTSIVLSWNSQANLTAPNVTELKRRKKNQNGTWTTYADIGSTADTSCVDKVTLDIVSGEPVTTVYQYLARRKNIANNTYSPAWSESAEVTVNPWAANDIAADTITREKMTPSVREDLSTAKADSLYAKNGVDGHETRITRVEGDVSGLSSTVSQQNGQITTLKKKTRVTGDQILRFPSGSGTPVRPHSHLPVPWRM